MASTWFPLTGPTKRRFLDWGARWLWRGADVADAPRVARLRAEAEKQSFGGESLAAPAWSCLRLGT